MTPPLIFDTDLGGDPDGAIALVLAARQPELVLVLTSDEVGGQRARLARQLLDLAGRLDITEATRWACRYMTRPFTILGLAM